MYAQYIRDHTLPEVVADCLASIRQQRGLDMSIEQASRLPRVFGYTTILPLAVASEYLHSACGLPSVFVFDLFQASLASCQQKHLGVALYADNSKSFACKARWWAFPTGDPNAGKSPACSFVLGAFEAFAKENVDLLYHDQHWIGAGNNNRIQERLRALDVIIISLLIVYHHCFLFVLFHTPALFTSTISPRLRAAEKLPWDVFSTLTKPACWRGRFCFSNYHSSSGFAVSRKTNKCRTGAPHTCCSRCCRSAWQIHYDAELAAHAGWTTATWPWWHTDYPMLGFQCSAMLETDGSQGPSLLCKETHSGPVTVVDSFPWAMLSSKNCLDAMDCISMNDCDWSINTNEKNIYTLILIINTKTCIYIYEHHFGIIHWRLASLSIFSTATPGCAVESLAVLEEWPAQYS